MIRTGRRGAGVSCGVVSGPAVLRFRSAGGGWPRPAGGAAPGCASAWAPPLWGIDSAPSIWDALELRRRRRGARASIPVPLPPVVGAVGAVFFLDFLSPVP